MQSMSVLIKTPSLFLVVLLIMMVLSSTMLLLLAIKAYLVLLMSLHRLSHVWYVPSEQRQACTACVCAAILSLFEFIVYLCVELKAIYISLLSIVK